MEVHFTPEQEAQLTQLATEAGTDAERLVKEVVLRLLDAKEPSFQNRIRITSLESWGYRSVPPPGHL
jgi:hypothetical protein